MGKQVFGLIFVQVAELVATLFVNWAVPNYKEIHIICNGLCV
jgi:hypothetical protein